MHGRVEHGSGIVLLDHLPLLHDHDAVGNTGNEADIVGDEDHRHAGVGAQFGEQRHDLGLHCHIERGRRLVGYEEARAAGESHGNHHPLAHAARQLVRIVAITGFRVGNAHPVQHVERRATGFGAAQVAVEPECLLDLGADRVHRIERGHRLLEDHADIAAPHAAHDLFAGPGHVQ